MIHCKFMHHTFHLLVLRWCSWSGAHFSNIYGAVLSLCLLLSTSGVQWRVTVHCDFVYTYIFFSILENRWAFRLPAYGKSEQVKRKKKYLGCCIILACLSIVSSSYQILLPVFHIHIWLVFKPHGMCGRQIFYRVIRWASSPDFFVKLWVWCTACNSEPWAIELLWTHTGDHL